MKRFFVLLLVFLLSVPTVAQTRSLSLIRDAESEALINELARPILLQAGLVPEHTHIYLINSSVLNAFVAGGQNIFLHTGLITYSDDPNMLSGVIAHETGHIEGGHLVRTREDLENAGIGAIASAILGAATIAAGAPGLGQALIFGGSHIAERSALGYTRGKEESADQAAVRYLEPLGVSLQGLIDLLEELHQQQRRQFEEVNEYARTHPLSRNRIQFLKQAMVESKAFSKPAPEETRRRYARMVAKIRAFIEPPKEVRRAYPASDQSEAAQLARAVLAHRSGDTKQAVSLLDPLINARPEDGFLYELKGQFLYEGGRAKDSVAAYKKAFDLKAEEPLIALGLGVSHLSVGQTEKAIDALKISTKLDPKNAIAWRQLGIAQGKAGNELLSHLALAEASVLQRDKETAQRFIALAKPLAKHDAVALLRLQDMEREMERWRKDDKS